MHDAALVAILVVLASFMYLRWRISRLGEANQLRSQLARTQARRSLPPACAGKRHRCGATRRRRCS